MTCDRHRPLYDYGLQLTEEGLDGAEVEEKLEEVAGNDPKMVEKVRGVMRSLSSTVVSDGGGGVSLPAVPRSDTPHLDRRNVLH